MGDWDQLASEIRAFVHARGWEAFHDPKNLSMAVAAEAGELAAELRWIASEETDQYAKDPAVHARLAAEAADVAITLLMFAARAEIDLPRAVRDKLEKNAVRYPETFLPCEERDWSFIPLAARRALDHAGTKLSLEGWRALPMHARAALVSQGVGAVDVAAVNAILATLDPPPSAPARRAGPIDPGEDAIPRSVLDALGEDRALSIDAWRSFSPLARFAYAMYAERGKVDRVRDMHDSLTPDRA